MRKTINTNQDNIIKGILSLTKVIGILLKQLIKEFHDIPETELITWLDVDKTYTFQIQNLAKKIPIHELTEQYTLKKTSKNYKRKKKLLKKRPLVNRQVKQKGIIPDVVFKVTIPQKYQKKLGFVDGKCEDYFIVNFEMQQKNTYDLLYRSELYTSFLSLLHYEQHTAKKQPYNQIRKIYSVWFCRDTIFTKNNNIKTKLSNQKEVQTQDMFIHEFGMAQYYNTTNYSQPFYNPYMDSRRILFVEFNKIPIEEKTNDILSTEMQQLQAILKIIFKINQRASNPLSPINTLSQDIYNQSIRKEVLHMIGISHFIEEELEIALQEKEKEQQIALQEKEREKQIALQEKQIALQEKEKEKEIAEKLANYILSLGLSLPE